MLRLVFTRVLLPLVVIVTTLAIIMPTRAQTGFTPRDVTATLRGSGATSMAVLFLAWEDVYDDLARNVALTYNAGGSGQGHQDFIGYRTEFGFTDAAISAGRVQTQAPDTLHIPVVVSAVMPIYNVSGLTNLRFSGSTLADIYLGNIKKWNDPRIVADNPGVTLPANLDIRVVYRSDPSGSTAIWTDYLSKISIDWNRVHGSGLALTTWPVGERAVGNAGMVSRIRNTPGAIGYAERALARSLGLPETPVKNAMGRFIAPSPSGMVAAAANIDTSGSLAVSITNSANADAYPITGFTYALVRQNTYTNLAQAQALTDFLYWGLTQGSGAAERLYYVPLPANVREAAIRQLETVVVGEQRAFTAP